VSGKAVLVKIMNPTSAVPNWTICFVGTMSIFPRVFVNKLSAFGPAKPTASIL
jgi:hypothetical protein